MKSALLRIILFAAAAAASSLHADTNTNSAAIGKDLKAPVVAAPATNPLFNLTLSENYDSLYMFRGINELPSAGILSTSFEPVWHITSDDTLAVPLWYATAVGKTYSNGLQNYRELDVPVNYSHTIGNWTLCVGYQLYTYYNLEGVSPGGTGIQQEATVNLSYAYKTGNVTWTPSIAYFYELGTANNYEYGTINAGSSFLSPQLAIELPLYKDILTANPTVQYNFSFAYNDSSYNDGELTKPYTGANNFQVQLPITWQITKVVSIMGYVAYSYQGSNLFQTAPSTIWAGASVGLSF